MARVVGYLAYVNLTLDDVVFEPRVRLRKVTRDDIQEMAALGLADEPLRNIARASFMESAVEVTGAQKPMQRSDHRAARLLVDQVVLAIQLVTGVAVTVPVLLVHDEIDAPRTFKAGWFEFQSWPRDRASLTEADKDGIVRVWQRLTCAPEDPPLALASRRWGLALHRTDESDSLIDAWVGLESLYVSGAHQEVGYRSGLRIAAFLGPTGEERARLYREVRESYALRSAIVHGTWATERMKKHWSPEKVTATVAATRDWLRMTLLRITRDGAAFDPESSEAALLRN